MDALVVKTRTGARNILTLLAGSDHGAVRLLAADSPAISTISIDETSLLQKVSFAKELTPLAQQLLGHVFVTKTLQSIPLTLPAGALFVTQQGELLTAEGAAEIWQPEDGEINPLGRHHLREQLQTEIQTLEKELAQKSTQLEQLQTQQTHAGDALETARTELTNRRRKVAIQEGETQVIGRELNNARDRVETVTFELNALLAEKGSGEDRRTTVARESAEGREQLMKNRQALSKQAETLNTLEERRGELLAETSECRIQFSQYEQRLESLLSRRQPLEARLNELRELIDERTRGIDRYQERITTLNQTTTTAQEQLEQLTQSVSTAEAQLTHTRGIRSAKTITLSEQEKNLRDMQEELESLQNGKTGLEVELAEQRMRHQNTTDRLTANWNITVDDLSREPEWDDEIPSMDDLETTVAEYRAKLDSMGPVNLVAIEEHAELEERFAFLNQQEDDLNKAKKQLLEMIKKINATTTELFKETFDKVNANFGEMFKQLFGGGSAKLVLVDEEDILESGIEIIARPPGKKLQTISLLSGGERTMTAVALLFSLFKVKPSPFCVLDELDAALDEANIGRFIIMVNHFLTSSQFILITHSRRTIAEADVIYGVTMPNRGVSRVMSMKFADYQEDPSSPA